MPPKTHEVATFVDTRQQVRPQQALGALGDAINAVFPGAGPRLRRLVNKVKPVSHNRGVCYGAEFFDHTCLFS